MRRAALALAAAAAALSGCDCGPTGADGRRYACTGDDECAPGFTCLLGQCRRPGEVVPAQLAFVSAAQALSVGACSAIVTVQVQDASGNAANVSVNTTVTLSAAPAAGMSFYASPSCTGAPLGTLVIGTGTSSGTFYFTTTTAGAITLTASAGSLSPANQVETLNANPTGALAFITPAQSVAAGACSQAATIQARDGFGNVSPVSADAAIALSASPGAGVTFYAGTGCTGPAVTGITMPAGTSSATFSFRGTAAGAVTLTGTSAFGSAMQVETIAPGPPASLRFSTGPRTVLARACSGAVTLAFVDVSGNPTTVSADTAIPLSVAPAPGMGLYEDPACTAPVSGLAFAAGTGSATVYLRGLSGGTFTLTAAPAGMPSVGQAEVILPTVRGGSCRILGGSTSVTCGINPAQLDLTRTFLVFQAVPGADNTPSSSNTRCKLTSLSTIICSRVGTGASAVDIAWQTVELPGGINVQHVDATCDLQTVVTVPIAPVVDVSSTFLLFSHEGGVQAQDDDDFFTADLTSPSAVTINMTGACTAGWIASMEVVEISGISVLRGTAQFAAMSGLASVSGLPAADPLSSFLLYSWRMSAPASNAICDRTLEGAVMSSDLVEFRRGTLNGTAPCFATTLDVAWQRVDLRALGNVQQARTGMQVGALSTDYTLQTAVDPTRTLVLSGGQGMVGQALGQSDYAGDDIIGEASARLMLIDPGTLRLTRGSSLGGSSWSSFAIQLQ